MRWIISSLTVALSLIGPAESVIPLRARIEVENNTRVSALDGVHNTASQPAGKLNTTIWNVFSRSLHHFGIRQTVGRCGADFGGQRCGNNQCCSSYGYCGTDPEHCTLLVGCQPDYGRCGDAPEPTPTPTPAPPSSPPVISSSSTIVPTTSSVLPPVPSGTLIVSPNGQCGNVTTCSGSTFGRCCSEYYYCGNSPAFCGTGCRPGFGACDAGLPPIVSSSVPVPIPPTSSIISSSSLSRSSTSIIIPTPTSTPRPTPTPSSTAAPVPTNVSTNGRCGPEGNGMTCQGSSFGRCCSEYGWCGNLSPDFCSVAWGCRPQFGTCG